jgi:phage shock protein A
VCLITDMQGTCDNLRMSEEDLIRAKGRTLHEYQQCKDRLGTLEGEAERAAKLLESVVSFLRSTRKDERFATGGLEEALSGKLIILMNDLHNTRNEHERLRRSVNVD